MTTEKKALELPVAKTTANLKKQLEGNLTSAKSNAAVKAQEDVTAAISRTVATVEEDKAPVVLTVRGGLSRTGFKNVSFQMEVGLIEAFDAFLGKHNKGAAINHAICLMMAGYLERYSKDKTGIVADVEKGTMGVVSPELDAFMALVKAQQA